MPSKKRRAQLKQADQAPLVAYSDEEEADGGFTLTGAEVLSESPQPSPSTSELPPMELACTLQGVMSGLSGGALGYVFGFGMSSSRRGHGPSIYITLCVMKVVRLSGTEGRVGGRLATKRA